MKIDVFADDFGLTNQSVNFLLGFLGRVVTTLIRPVATVTEVFFRRKMGERYFSPVGAFAGLVLIVVASLPFLQVEQRYFGFPGYRFYPQQRIRTDWVELPYFSWRYTATVVGVAWAVLYLGLALVHHMEVRHRYRTGEQWHSYCSGVPWVGLAGSGFVQRFLIVLAAAAGVCVGIYGIVGLLLVSCWCSYMLRVWEQKRFHEMMLDTIDQRIEMQHLQQAIQERLHPRQAEGFSAPLPAYVSDEYRKRFIESVSGGRRQGAQGPGRIAPHGMVASSTAAPGAPAAAT